MQRFWMVCQQLGNWELGLQLTLNLDCTHDPFEFAARTQLATPSRFPDCRNRRFLS
jgi:hypothetical protein